MRILNYISRHNVPIARPSLIGCSMLPSSRYEFRPTSAR